MPDKFPVRRPVNAVQGIIQDFLDGAPFTEQLCDKVTATYCSSGDSVSYKRKLEFVKVILSQGKHFRVDPDVYAVETSFDFDNIEQAMVIRLINLCYHGERIITLNNSIIYIPKELRHYTEEEIRIHTYKRIQDVKTSWFGVWRERRAARLKRKSIRTLTIDMQLAASA